MDADIQPESALSEVPCSYHPSVMTMLRCSRCGKPICPRCAVRTPVGMRCPACAGQRTAASVVVDEGATSIVVPALVGLAIAVGVGVAWGFIPQWGFYLALVLGFGVAEGMARFLRGARGTTFQLLGMGLVVVGLVTSRVVLANQLGVDWELIRAGVPGVREAMYLRISPDLVFAVMAVLIPWVRFRA